MAGDRDQCPSCGDAVFASDDVCMSCGAALTPGAEPQPDAEPPSPVPATPTKPAADTPSLSLDWDEPPLPDSEDEVEVYPDLASTEDDKTYFGSSPGTKCMKCWKPVGAPLGKVLLPWAGEHEYPCPHCNVLLVMEDENIVGHYAISLGLVAAALAIAYAAIERAGLAWYWFPLSFFLGFIAGGILGQLCGFVDTKSDVIVGALMWWVSVLLMVGTLVWLLVR